MVQGIGLLVQIILARLLMPEDFASLAIITAIVNYLGLFVQSGISIVIVQKKNLSGIDIATLTTISLMTALIMYIGLYFLAPWISQYYDVGNLISPIRVMGISLFLFAFNSIQTGLLQRKMMFKSIFYRSLLATPLSGIIGITMAYMGFGIWSLVAYNLSNIFTIVLFMNMIPEIRLKIGFNLKTAKGLYSFCLKILGTSLISAGGDTVRTLTIGKYFNANQLAYFDRGLNYSSLVTQVVNTSLSSVLLPVLSRTQDNLDNLKEITRKSVGVSSFIMIPILVMVAVLSKPLVIIVLTEKWLPCAAYLSLFCLLRIPGIITSVDRQAYYALGKSQIGLYYEIALLIANIAILLLMIPHGIYAIGLGFTIVEYIGCSVLCLVSSKVFGYTILQRILDIYKSVFNSLIMALILSYVAIRYNCTMGFLLLQIILGCLVYVIMALITKDKNLKYIISKISFYG